MYARQQAQAARQAEQARKAHEREEKLRRERELVRRAELQTAAVEQRMSVMRDLLGQSLISPVRLDPVSLKRSTALPALDLGQLAAPISPPQWAEFEPAAPSVLGKLFGGQQRHEVARRQAGERFTQAQAHHATAEKERQKAVVAARAEHQRHTDRLRQEADRHNAEVDALFGGLATGERMATSSYFEKLLTRSRYPEKFPRNRRVGFVPESKLLAVEFELPAVSVIPPERGFRAVKTRMAIDALARPADEIRKTYQTVVAQVAIRTLREVFLNDTAQQVETVVFNGIVDAIDPATGRKIRPCLITLRATREKFAPLVLENVDPVACVRKYFFAEVSRHPDELEPVEPVMEFDLADPRIIDPVDVISGLDPRPNLMELDPKKFEAFIQNLFTRMGFDTKLFAASGDGGVDCVAFDPRPIVGGKFVVQAKLYSKTVQPSAVRDLYGTMQHEGATKGILITTSGYGPGSYEFANGKPLQLIDGSGLLALCKQHGISARIVPTTKR